MPTFGELKSRVAKEINRDDVDGCGDLDLTGILNQSIRYYASKRFWFNQKIGTTTTTASDSTVARPTGLRFEDVSADGWGAFITVSGDDRQMRKRSLLEIQCLRAGNTSENQPTDYADNGANWELYPTPNAVYTLTAPGVYDETAITDDSTSTDWTNNAEDLITARARIILGRDWLFDESMEAAASRAEGDALRRLVAETTRRVGTGVIRGHL